MPHEWVSGSQRALVAEHGPWQERLHTPRDSVLGQGKATCKKGWGLEEVVSVELPASRDMGGTKCPDPGESTAYTQAHGRVSHLYFWSLAL